MIASKTGLSLRQPAANTSGEENSFDIVRDEGLSLSKATTETAVELSSGATSIAEIETLVDQLQAARSYLQSEGERIRRDLARYAHLSHAASASVKVITQSLGQWHAAQREVI